MSKRFEPPSPRNSALEDLKSYLADLQTLYRVILALADKNDNKAAIQVLLDSALSYAANLDDEIKNCGGVGFISIDSTLDFIWNLEHRK